MIRRRRARGASQVGQLIEVDVGAVAHGGFCVARHEGRAVFVRHALPGERVRAVVTEGADGDRYWRADAVDVLDPSAGRVPAPCPYAGPGRCGGCDWQHASTETQRGLKASVVSEQLRRLAGIDWSGEVEAVCGDDAGLGWRTRVTFSVDADGRLGLRRHRSHETVPVDACLIAHPAVADSGVLDHRWPGVESVEVVASSSGERAVVVTTRAKRTRLPRPASDVSVVVDGERVRGRTYVTEQAAGRPWRVSGGGFWQVHPGAADALVGAVLEALAPRPGETTLDLYAGVGLFAGALAEQVGTNGSVVAVEEDRRAVADARRNLHDLGQARIVPGRVEHVLAAQTRPSADLVVLDPPRTGAGALVVAEIVRRHPRAVGYVACDPAALARDIATFGSHGYTLAGLRAFDLFPMTHHVECVATLMPSDGR